MKTITVTWLGWGEIIIRDKRVWSLSRSFNVLLRVCLRAYVSGGVWVHVYVCVCVPVCVHVYVSESEQEEQWLQDAGLSTLISEDVEKAVLLSTLTRTQAATVQKRLDSYTLSIRKKNKPQPRDVREIFTSTQVQPELV